MFAGFWEGSGLSDFRIWLASPMQNWHESSWPPSGTYKDQITLKKAYGPYTMCHLGNIHVRYPKYRATATHRILIAFASCFLGWGVDGIRVHPKHKALDPAGFHHKLNLCKEQLRPCIVGQSLIINIMSLYASIK